MNDKRIYDSNFVRELFDEMSTTYGIVNLISSFGFTILWRRQCARSINVEPGFRVLDLMSGMGELCFELSRRLDSDGQLIGLDLSPVMCRQAEKLDFDTSYRVIEADALDCPLDDDSVDCVFSSFGLKTFDNNQLDSLASEIHRVLRPGGEFSFLEISVPPNRVLRAIYMFYLRQVIPVLGRLFMGNPENYRMLGEYTSAFGDCKVAADLFAANGLQVEFRSYFFGCATGVIGAKPIAS
jgi:demethylmenaquinone methyltransferase/2-methoxy-6-polyprenyl-1,4-benzoquinol methylase